jgi:hypothetical protein
MMVPSLAAKAVARSGRGLLLQGLAEFAGKQRVPPWQRRYILKV